MNEKQEKEVERLVETVRKKKKYTHIHSGLIRTIAESELAKGRKRKGTEKAILSKLHQIGGAYFTQPPDYAEWQAELDGLSDDIHAEETRDLCIRVMKSHHSTDERLYILKDFYQKTLASIQPIPSILDLACGLNPLALPWMPVEKDVQYTGCDIFRDMIDFLNAYAGHFHLNAQFTQCNILDAKYPQKAKVAFVLKTLPCLEQVQKGFAPLLLERIPTDYILFSYPISSLSGRGKGMRETYTAQFKTIMADKGWQYEQFDFSSELAFLVEKG